MSSTTLWTATATAAADWELVEQALRRSFFADANVPCEALETAAYKNFRLRCRQALITDTPLSASVFLPGAHKLACDAHRDPSDAGRVRALVVLSLNRAAVFDTLTHEAAVGAKRACPPSP